MVGVSFTIIKTSNPLWQILKCIDVEKYHWYNIENQNESWGENIEDVLFDSVYYNGKDFLETIKSNHFIVFIKLQAYLTKTALFNIQTFDDFINSTCQLVLLIHDCNFVEVYAKDQDIISSIYNNALMNNYLGVNFITWSDNKRYSFDLL